MDVYHSFCFGRPPGKQISPNKGIMPSGYHRKLRQSNWIKLQSKHSLPT